MSGKAFHLLLDAVGGVVEASVGEPVLRADLDLNVHVAPVTEAAGEVEDAVLELLREGDLPLL